MSMKPNPKEINIILNILKGAQFEFLPRTPFYIDTPLVMTQHISYSGSEHYVLKNRFTQFSFSRSCTVCVHNKQPVSCACSSSAKTN
jgi:hypothetical protein